MLHVRLGFLAQRGINCGTADAPALGLADAVLVEQYEPQQPESTNASEQVGDLRRLARRAAAPVSAMSIGSHVSSRTSAMVGPNKEANQDDCSSSRQSPPNSHTSCQATRRPVTGMPPIWMMLTVHSQVTFLLLARGRWLRYAARRLRIPPGMYACSPRVPVAVHLVIERQDHPAAECLDFSRRRTANSCRTAPLAMLASEIFPASICTSVTAPCFAAEAAKPTWNGLSQTL